MAKASAAAKAVAQEQPAQTSGDAAIKQAMADALPPISALLANQWKARESGVFFNTHEVVPNAGTPFENLLRREFWGNVSQKMKPGDTIIAFPRDGQWYAELVVWDAGQNWAHVSPRFHMERPAFGNAPGVDNDFEIGRDPIDGVIVKRRSTGAVLKKNFPNHEDARRWILDQQRVLKR
jgi:hypothetical protein